MKALFPFLFLIAVSNFSCSTKTAQSDDSRLSASQKKAQRIVDKAINVHGGKNYIDLNIEFDFRKRHYRVKRKGGTYTYERTHRNKAGAYIHDILTNVDFVRYISDQEVRLDEKQKAGYSNSLNSVVYFILLPYLLNDAAVIKDYAGEETIKGNEYHKIKVTFKEKGGGIDFEDQYCYWISKKTNTMDYLAYNFHVNGGGARFRSAHNIRTIKGIRFADYINYNPVENTVNVSTFAHLYQNNGLLKLSKIETENIIVH